MMKRTNVHLTDLQIERLKEYSTKLGGLPVAEVIRRAVDEFLWMKLGSGPTKTLKKEGGKNEETKKGTKMSGHNRSGDIQKVDGDN